MIKVTYLDHSGFVLSTPTAILVFDYSKDPDKKLEKVLAEYPDPEVPVVFFVTHHHPDHFNQAIFDLAQNRKRVYVLSNDIFSKLVPQKGFEVAWMSAGDVVDTIRGIESVKAYGSTDAGVSYLVSLPDGTTVFHAGDLNFWHWAADSTEQEVDKAKADFDTIVNRIAKEHPSVNIVMFPVDARMGEGFAKGANMFLEKIKTDFFFPMHFWGEPNQACDFKKYVPPTAHTICYCLDRPGAEATIM